MPLTQLRKIDVQGFRSFGAVRQAQYLADTVSVFWGGNSQGKTSLAEAFEFLFTGQISRRELLASAKDEFAEALRNVHIDPGILVQVEAQIACPDGQVRRLTRTLTEDYKRGGAAGCNSRIEIDGAPCAEVDLEKLLGMRLSHPPLRAPVLTQHTLGYLFTASPTDRAAYFRALLDTQDLEDFRTAVAGLQTRLTAPVLSELQDLAAVEAIALILTLSRLIRKAKSLADVQKQLVVCISAVLKAVKIEPAGDLAGQAGQLDDELQKRRMQAFPVALFDSRPFSPWPGIPTTTKPAVDTFLGERAKVAAETRRLVELFTAALEVPNVVTAHEPIDCPLCTATNTLTPARIANIREQVKATESYSAALTEFDKNLRELDGKLETVSRSADQALPKFTRETRASRLAQKFTVARIRALAQNDAAVSNWLRVLPRLLRTTRRFQSAVAVARAQIADGLMKPDDWNDTAVLDACLDAIVSAQQGRNEAQVEYAPLADAVLAPLKEAVDQSTATQGWEALIRLARAPAALWIALVALQAHTLMIASVQEALREIDAASGKVADEKFTDLSDDVRFWWNKLRPDEPAFFNSIQRRGDKTRRTIDLKVGLSAKEDKSNPKFRDAVAVFSQSQLHCLGLSLFLARAVQDKCGFIVLDDPVLTSDDDFRPNFASSVIEGLLDAGIQVIVLTQDHASWKDIGHRWEHRGVAQVQLFCNDALSGTEIRNQSDGLATLIAKAQPFIKSEDPDNRKQGAMQLRIAIERFGKELLVKSRRAKGDGGASITDYEGQNFGVFGPDALLLLTKDPAHPGKLTAAHNYVTPGPHDDTPPSKSQLAMASGDLKKLKKEYLG